MKAVFPKCLAFLLLTLQSAVASAANCSQYFDPDSCNRDYCCAWDPTEAVPRCEAQLNAPPECGGCESITDPVQCNQTWGCAWDPSEPPGGRCEDRTGRPPDAPRPPA